MSTQNEAPRNNQNALQTVWSLVKGILVFFWEIIRALARMVRATLLLFINTPPELLPSVVQTSSADEAYNQRLFKKFEEIGNLLPLDQLQSKVLAENWFSQMQWVESRATRERNANELIRWWQIILGVLIPVFIQFDTQELRIAASLSGIFVAVITAVHQFRRPDERWRHYRVLSERYQMEFWDFVTLSGENYAGKTHKEVFDIFNGRMNDLKREDIGKFFGEIVPAATASTEKLLADMRTSLQKQGLLPNPDEE